MIADILKLWQYSERKFFLELWVATFLYFKYFRTLTIFFAF